MRKAVIGFLPLYLELYDQVVPDNRRAVEDFTAVIKAELEKTGVAVIPAPVCRVKSEFAAAVESFERSKADAIVTLHLAYSPSLESIDALAASPLPVIILDTTPDFDFGFNADDAAIMRNHGIHGVQDLCNLLLRKGKRFLIETGHWQKSDVLARVGADVKACVAVSSMKNAKVGLIGEPFHGMGDFAIPFPEIKRLLGISVVQASAALFDAFCPAPDEIEKELELYRNKFRTIEASEECLHRTAVTSLKVRQWIRSAELTAFTFNFLNIDHTSGLDTVPFLEASMAMSRGIGYAGEGDVLTAAFVSSLAAIFPETTFSEMFCPDWEGNRVFLSHMGEINIDLIDGGAELVEKAFPFFSVSPALARGCMKPGKAALVNLAPGPDDAFSMIVCPGTLAAPAKSKMTGIAGWFEPEVPLDKMLSVYSQHGGTHHLALVYDHDLVILRSYALVMGWDFVEMSSNEILHFKKRTLL